jgi:hypothetical protein
MSGFVCLTLLGRPKYSVGIWQSCKNKNRGISLCVVGWLGGGGGLRGSIGRVRIEEQIMWKVIDASVFKIIAYLPRLNKLKVAGLPVSIGFGWLLCNRRKDKFRKFAIFSKNYTSGCQASLNVL